MNSIGFSRCRSGHATLVTASALNHDVVAYALFLMLLAAFTLLPSPPAMAASVGPLAVQVTAPGDGGQQAPAAGITVHVGGRHAATDDSGVAVFNGLPAGSYSLAVRHPGFEALERRIDIPAGQRQPLALHLVPAPAMNWSARVLVEGLDQPLAGARVDLRPRAVKAAVAGPVRGVSGWDGVVEAADLPGGLYAVEVTAPGFEPWRGELTIDTSTEAFDAPKVDDIPLDICLEWGSACGKPAADAWCRANGFFASAAHTVEQDSPPTRVIGSGKVCEEDHCDRIASLTCIGRADVQGFALRRVSQGAQLTVQVVDDGGRPLTADVTVAEVWPDGVVAEGRTGGDGTVTFADLRTGAVNRADAEGRVGIARRALTVRAEAEGYVPAVVRGQLAAGPQQVRVELTPVRVREEQEPNDQEPEALAIGVSVSFTIAEPGDHDQFLVRLPEPALLKLLIAEGSPLETHLRLYDSDGRLLKHNGAHTGRANAIEQAVPAGSYRIDVSEWGENNRSDQPLTLVVTSDPAVDPREPNDSDEAASPLRPGEQLVGLIWPQGDRDVYRVQVERPGYLRVHGDAMPLERHLIVRDAAGTKLGEHGAYVNRRTDLMVQVAPGEHFIEVREWGDNDQSLVPYRIAVDLLPDDGVDDPPLDGGRMAAVRTLAPGSAVGSTLLPRGDVDVYSIAVPGAGRLHVRTSGEMEKHIQLFDAEGRLLGQHGSYAGHSGALASFVEGPATLFAAIREWGDNAWSPAAYSLSAWLEPADELDFLQRNDDFARALPLLPGDTVHGNYLPIGDRDVYAVEIDFPGYLAVSARSALETHLRVFDADGALVAQHGAYKGKPSELAPPVAAGRYFVMVGEWGDNQAAVDPYTLSLRLDRAEPDESWPLAEDAPRRLVDGEARAFSIDQRGDRDRFLFDMPQAGEVTLSVAAPLETLIRVYDDRTGERLLETARYAPARFTTKLALQGPTRLRVELSEWGDNNASLEPGFVMLDTRGRTLVADALQAEVDPGRPQRVSFSRRRLDYAEAPSGCEVDLNGDGRGEVRLAGEEGVKGEFPAQGLYVVEAVCNGPDGQRSRQRLWVQATGPQERAGILLSLNNLSEGQVVDTPLTPQVQAVSFDGSAIARVEFALDGRRLDSDYEAPYETAVDWQGLSGGEHTLAVRAVDATGTEATLERRFVLSEYFGLTPPDGAALTGESVRVSWNAPAFGPARVRYRAQGSEAWQEAVGDSGRQRSVVLRGLETGITYEYQPLGGAEAGPLRTVTRVKGLAFGKPRYGANIRRDYDQRAGISVRNNGDEPLTVRLEGGAPSDPLLLVGFVGEGSEDRPFELAPGEEREFLLGISAQDVVTADHTVPLRIVSDNGLSDEVELAVHVQLPVVKLEWEDRGAAPDGQGRILRLVNRGDPVTDLAVVPEDPNAVVITPTVRHGLLGAGRSMDFTVTPQFYEGFTGVETNVIARGLDKQFAQPYAMQLGPGESVHRVWLFPGAEAATGEGVDPRMLANAERAGSLDPASVDWSRRDAPEDLDGDGQPDRWSFRVGDVLWVGDDSDGDGAVDFVHADIGDDGVFEYSALLEDGAWTSTNLVEAWLEMGFSLPWNRDSYKEHDADVVLNDVVIGRLRDAIPEGNYTFRIPPRALRFDESGRPGDNRVGIRSKHLRGGHYVVNSDFRFKFRLTATPVWSVATSPEKALQTATAMAGLSLSAPDLSVSSSELHLIAPDEPKAGDELALEIPLRNLGAVSPPRADVALFRVLPGNKRQELGRTSVARPPLSGAATARITWNTPGGANSLVVVADPDGVLGDTDPSNNEAMTFIQVAGDNTPPTLEVKRPADGARQASPLVDLVLSASDDSGAHELELSVDGGLWESLEPDRSGAAQRVLLLQPGEHRLDLRARDGSGNLTEVRRSVTVAAEPPVARILAPAAGASLEERIARVRVEVPPDAALAGVRVAGGPWYKAVLAGGEASVEVPLRFGPQTLEAMVADGNGVVTLLQSEVRCTAQRQANETEAAPVSEAGVVWPGRGDLALDLFQRTSGVLAMMERPEPVAEPEESDDARARYERARALREEGGALQAAGKLAEAAARYRKSLELFPDPRLEAHIRVIEQALRR